MLSPLSRLIMEKRLDMNPDRPNGKAWLSAYKVDVRELLAAVDELTKSVQTLAGEKP